METNTSNQPVTISTDPPVNAASDFWLLRNEGLQWIQKLAGNSWTDHNTHDPGITILDLLCYAITDLSYRLDYDIKDLLATENGNGYESLYSPVRILTVNPVTLSDFRKVLLDVDSVKNAWIEKQTTPDVNLYFFPEENVFRLTDNDSKGQPLVIKGIYNISVDLESGGNINAVRNRLQSKRNLCEDFNNLTALSPQYIAVSGIIEIGQIDDINKTAAGILTRIASFVSPVINFYTLSELLAKGKTIDEIFEGPVLFHGFIDDDELNSANVKTQLYTSDIIREMMDEPGVLRVNNISIFINGVANSVAGQNWFLQLDTTKIPELDIEELNGKWLTEKFIFRKNDARLTIDKDKVKSYYNEFKNAQANPALSIKDRDIVPEHGNYYAIENYYSIQNHFPQVYGIGETGLADSVSPLRIAQAKQLKAYLLFFEQILADYFSQAGHLKDLFSFSNTKPDTYFYQPLQNIVPGAEEILFAGSNNRIPGYIESYDSATQRKSRFLDHLIARFGESLAEYSLNAQSFQQWKNKTNSTTSANSPVTTTFEKLVSDKLRFLANYPLISNDRGKAFNYQEESWDTDNVSGLEKRIAAKIGIETFNRHNLTVGSADEEGFHLLEHILLRPVQEDTNAITPYLVTKSINSFQDAGNGRVICHSTEHGLFTGDQVTISQSDAYTNKIYTVTYLSPDSFQIQSAFQETKLNTAQWTRVINTNYLVFAGTNKLITAFTKDSGDQTIICASPGHDLANGANIEIKRTSFLDGLYNVIKIINKDSFKINLPGTEPDSYEGITGTWTRIIQPDFYSLQLTCLFPAWPTRFANADFRTFIENTVRKETPVHLTVYIIWLEPDQMLQFEKPFQSFLKEIQGEQSIDRNDLLKSRKIKWRAYRNSLIDILPLGINSYPLADIPVVMPENATELVIQYNEPARITLMYSQPDVAYRIWDEMGTQMNKSQNDDDNRGNDGQLSVVTVPLTRDNYLFSIEAFNPVTKLSVRLFQTVLARTGINTGLLATAKESVVDYGTPAVIVINNAQSGTIYQLFDANDVTKVLSDANDSHDGGYLEISTTDPLFEDKKVVIKATNTHTKESATLDARPEIQVYPNTALEIAIKEPQVADYHGDSAIILKNTQESASYYLRFEDIDDDTVNKEALKGTMIGKPVPGNKGTIMFPVKDLTEDLTVSITARKNTSGIEKTLPERIILLLKPDAKKTLSIVDDNIKAGDTATIKVSNTQRGILYQLRQVNSDNTFTNIGRPAYHSKNYGVGKARIEIDFAIDTFTGDSVLLPAGIIKQTTTFNVLAIKATTKQEAVIGNITVEIKP